MKLSQREDNKIKGLFQNIYEDSQPSVSLPEISVSFAVALKRNTAVFAILIFSFSYLFSAPLNFEPVSKRLPDGTTINIFASGDEFFNYLHDKDGYPLSEGADGFYYYTIQEGDFFTITGYRFGYADPSSIPGIKKGTFPSYVKAKREAFYKKIDEENKNKGINGQAKSSGVLNNLVIYIKFLGESNFTVPRSTYDLKFNNITGSSMRFYFREISYNNLDIVSYSFPGGATQDISYTDINPRSYYQPYSATVNTNGYLTDSERTTREHSLLANAVNWAKTNYSLPAGVNFDYDQNGIIDNICFIVKGSADGWNDLLWPHRWVLYSQTVTLGDLKVYGYTLQMESVSVITLSHEMFHALGAPDLYHYNNSEVPVGPWDLMASGGGHPGAWMKYHYGGWIDSLPEITKSGTYTIKALSQSGKNGYILHSPLSKDQFFVLEYRKRGGLYEINLPESGLIIQRIDTRYVGNSAGSPDEIYVFRPDGTPTTGGSINLAGLSDFNGITEFSDNSNPYGFMQNGTRARIRITGIISMTDSLKFTVEMDFPYDLILSPVEDNAMTVSWSSLNNKEFIVAASTTNEALNTLTGTDYHVGDHIGETGVIIYRGTDKSFVHSGLESDQKYYYTVWTIMQTAPVSSYSESVTGSQTTGIYATGTFPYEEGFDNLNTGLSRGWKATSGVSGWKLNTENAFSAPGSIEVHSPVAGQYEWLYTPGFSLINSNTYLFSFRYKNVNPGTKESLLFQGGNDRSYGGMLAYPLFNSTNFDYSDYPVWKVVFKPSESKTYYFAFKTPGTGSGVLIDDFRLEKVPSGTVTHTLPVDFYPNPTTGKITVPATASVKISVMSGEGKLLYQNSIETMQTIDLSSLGKGLFIIKFESGGKTSIRKIIIL